MIKSLKRLKIDGCYKIKLQSYEDQRGFFYKNYNYKEFKKLDLNTKWNEDFFSYSKKNVIRGMHFQNPPFAQFKLIMCCKYPGEIKVNVIRETRRRAYGNIGDQLDEIYKDIDTWKARIQSIKDANPKE